MDGLLGTARGTHLPTEEVRFGVVLNGGVSLAVWMGGTVHELDRLTKARERGVDRDPYAVLLSLVGCTARADVMTGTSAGGINGAALALAQVNRGADLSMLRDLWIEQGRLETLLRRPFQGDPTSLLKGDEYFLPALHDAMGRLAEAPGNSGPQASPVDLTITATVLGGNQTVSLDSMGQKLPQTVHAGLFHWRRGPRSPGEADPFDPGNLRVTAHQLALAARSTASFPVAFEPSFIPVNSPAFTGSVSGPAPEAEARRLHPDMGGVVRSWGTRSTRDSSRYVVDGGVLANTPTLQALEAVEAMEADGPVRRVMLLVYPHAPSPGEDPPSVFGTAPTVAGALNGMLGALTGQGSRTYVDRLEEHNRRAAGRRGTRSDILGATTPAGLHELAEQIYPHYRRLRVWRAGRDLSARLAGSVADGTTSSALPEGWNYERVRREAEHAQTEWQDEHGSLPYVPSSPADETEAASPGWGWGVSGALGVAEAVNEVLRRLVAALSRVDDGYLVVADARRTAFGLRASIESLRHDVDDGWATDRGDGHDAVISSLSPNRRFWSLRLCYYDYLMVGREDWAGVLGRIDDVADFEGRLAAALLPPGSAGAEGVAADRRARVRETLVARLEGNAARNGPRTAGSVGQQVGLLVGAVVEQLSRAVAAVDWTSLDEASWSFGEVDRWSNGLGLGELPSAEVLLDRLLDLEVAATALGDEVSGGATTPVELVQLSAQTENAFARHSRTADDKLGGWSLNRFGGFLKRSWRANDWTWGRVDAATVLCRTVLHPSRVRRTARLAGYLDEGTPDERADATLEELVEALFAESPPDLGPLRDRARAELVQLLDPDVDEGDLPAALPALADLFARAVHEQVVVEELPAITTAIRADKVEGGYQRSRGEVFLAAEEPLLTRLEAARGDAASLSAVDRARALTAFDAAGIGREPLADESTSDMSIRTATTAAAVVATVLSSGRSGLRAVAPVTRAVRGLMLLPYWVVIGLTGKGGLARSLSLLALGLGATVLALSLFGALPESISGPATALGASAVLVAFAYAALRTGTMLHGLVLLSPVIPLLTYSVVRARDVSDESASRGGTTLVVVVGLMLVLMVLGSFGATYGSVWSGLDGIAERRGVPLMTRPRDGSTPQRRSAPARWAEALALSVAPVLLGLVAIGAIAAAVVLALDVDWVAEFDDRAGSWWGWSLVVLVLVVATALGGWLAQSAGRSLRVIGRVPVTDASGQALVDAQGSATYLWTHQRLANPRGVAVGWSVLYGVAFELIALALLADPFDVHQEWWHRVALITAVLFAVALVLVVPSVLPLLEFRDIRRAERTRAVTVVAPDDYAVDLVARGLGYSHYVKGGQAPTLTRFGERLRAAASRARLGG